MNYSIIIPHKNAPQLLERCLKSIPQREDLEIVIVDDHSDVVIDGASVPSIERKDVRLVQLEQSHGAGYSRNTAVKLATGKWLMFADADDYFSEDISNILNKYADDTETDMVVLNAKAVDDEGVISSLSLNTYIDNYRNSRKNSKQVIQYGFWSPWSRMVKRNVVEQNDIKFEEVPVGNDMMFILKASRYSVHIKVESTIVYYYYKPKSGSVTSKYWTEKTKCQRFEASLKRNKFYAEVNYPYYVPIWREAKHIDKENKNELFKKYGYVKWTDFIHSARYFYAKYKHII